MTDRNELIKKLKKYYKNHGDVPHTKDFSKKIGLDSYKIYLKEFGCINNALEIADIPILQKNNLPSTKKLISDLKNLIDQLKRKPVAKDLIYANGVYSYAVYRNRFGSLKNALERAGYRTKSLDKLSKKELLHYLRKFYFKFGKSPNARDLKIKTAYPSYNQYKNKFGSLNIALKKAGLRINKYENISKNEYLVRLKNLAKKLGRTPRAKDLSFENDTPHYDSYRRIWGSLEKALMEAELEVNVKMNWTKEELLKSIHEFYLQNKRLPISKEYKTTKGFPSLTVFRRVFGGFNNAIKAWRIKYSVDINIKSAKRLNFVHIPKRNKTKKYLIKILKEALKKNKIETFSAKNLSHFNLPPVNIFINVFGSWNKALIAANIPLSKINSYEKNDLIEILQMIHKEKRRTPRVSDLGGKYPSYPSFQQHFGTWEEALATIGLKMSEGIYGKRARLWERKCEEISYIFYKNPIFQKSFQGIGRPDIYVPEKKLIIDAKLTSYDIKDKTQPQIIKYLRACSKIEFWCVHKTVETPYKNVRYVYAKDLIKKLKKRKQVKLASSVKRFLLERDSDRDEFGHYTKNDVIMVFKKFFNKHRRVPSIKEFDSLVNSPGVTTVRKLFGTYNNAVISAGLEPNRSGQSYMVNATDIIKQIKIFFRKNKRSPTLKELKIPLGSIKREFGNYQNALSKAGLPANKKYYSLAEIKDELSKIKGSVTLLNVKEVLRNHPKLPRWATLIRKLGSVKKLYQELGLV